MSNCSRGWDKRCPAAKGKRCTCRCGGERHGKAHQSTAVPPGLIDAINEATLLLHATPAVGIDNLEAIAKDLELKPHQVIL